METNRPKPFVSHGFCLLEATWRGACLSITLDIVITSSLKFSFRDVMVVSECCRLDQIGKE